MYSHPAFPHTSDIHHVAMHVAPETWADCLVTSLQGENSCAGPFPAGNPVPGDVLLECTGDHV